MNNTFKLIANTLFHLMCLITLCACVYKYAITGSGGYLFLSVAMVVALMLTLTSMQLLIDVYKDDELES